MSASTALEIVDALEEISMKEHFLSYWRKREQTSIKKAIDLVKNGKAMAMVSAGNTGAVMALAKTVLGSMKNIDRPALAIMLPTLKGSSLLVDVGANTDSKPHNLVEFALMGKIYLENIVRHQEPAHRPDEHRRGGGQGQRTDQDHPQPAQAAGHQLHRQRRGPRRLHRRSRPDRHRRLHRQRRP